MSEVNTKAPEQDPEYIRGQMESRKFLRRNPDFPINARNGETMQRELMKRNLPWTAENLQTVWNEIDRGLIDESEDRRPEAKPALEVTAPEAPPEFPWGARLEGAEGKARIAAMKSEEFHKCLTNKNTGSEFAAQIRSLGIRQAPFEHISVGEK
jgi:hypothetical protein